MRIVNCRQQSDEWDELRRRPTASNFGKFCTPARADYSKSATAYACVVIAKKLGVYTEAPPTYWMERGVELEPYAREQYTALTGREVVEVGFIFPDHTDSYGGSPDGLVGDDGMIEIKCLAPENLIACHASGQMPDVYKPQVQGNLMIASRSWCDFHVYHPDMTPFLLRVESNEKYQTKIAENLLRLLEEIERIELAMSL